MYRPIASFPNTRYSYCFVSYGPYNSIPIMPSAATISGTRYRPPKSYEDVVWHWNWHAHSRHVTNPAANLGASVLSQNPSWFLPVSSIREWRLWKFFVARIAFPVCDLISLAPRGFAPVTSRRRRPRFPNVPLSLFHFRNPFAPRGSPPPPLFFTFLLSSATL